MGAIEKRGENSYRLTVSRGYNKDGKKIRKYKTIDLSGIPVKKQQAEAERQFILFQEEIKKGSFVDNEKVTFEEFVEKWLKDYAQPHLQPKTLLEYKRLLGRITPSLGHIKLVQLQPTHLTEFYNSLRKDDIRLDKKPGGLTESTILHHHRLISSILTSAMQWGFILNNPSSRVKAPRIAKTEARHFDVAETDYILRLIEDEPIKYRVMITLAIYGGMRQGELTALTWSDVDFNSCSLNINKSLQHLPGRDTFVKATKTETTRVISVPEDVIDLLKEYKKWQNTEILKLGPLWHKSDSLFTTVSGKPIFPSTISKWFLKFIRRHNKEVKNDTRLPEEEKNQYLIREVNFHGLRHTNASLLIHQDVDIATISKRLGHAKISTTSDIYVHMFQKSDMEASDKLGRLFGRKDREGKVKGEG